VSVVVTRQPSGTCDPWLLSERRSPHFARVLYDFERHDADIFEARQRCWRHRPPWAQEARRPR